MRLADRKARYRALAVLALAIANTVLEALAALAVFGFVQLVTADVPDPSGLFSRLTRAFGPVSRDTLLIVAGASLAAFYLLKNLLLAFQTAFQSREANRVASDVAVRLFKSYLGTTAETFAQRNTSELVRNITTSVDAVLRQSLLAVVGLLSDCLILLGVLAVLLVQAPVVAPVAGGALCLMLLTTYVVLRRRLDRLGTEANLLQGVNLKQIQQGLGALREIKVLGRESYFIQNYARSRRGWADAQWKFDAVNQLPRLVFETVFIFSLVAIVAVVSINSESSNETVPVLGLFAYAGFRLLPSVGRITGALNTLRYGSDAVATLSRELDHVTTAPYAVQPPPGDNRSAGLFDEFRVDSLTYRYPNTGRDAVHDVSFSVLRGSQVGIVGPSGAGKSTLLDLLIGLLHPTSGRLLVDGRPVSDNLREWQSRIGYVPQVPFMTDDSILHNIALGIPASEIDMARVNDAVRLAQLSELTDGLDQGLHSVVGERGIRISGGQRQRIAIARALYHDPDILVFDEATSSLDYETERELTTSVQALTGVKTVIIVAHRLSSVRHCERIVLLKEGSVVDSGSFEHLQRTSPDFARLLRAGSLLNEPDPLASP